MKLNRAQNTTYLIIRFSISFSFSNETFIAPYAKACDSENR